MYKVRQLKEIAIEDADFKEIGASRFVKYKRTGEIIKVPYELYQKFRTIEIYAKDELAHRLGYTKADAYDNNFCNDAYELSTKCINNVMKVFERAQSIKDFTILEFDNGLVIRYRDSDKKAEKEFDENRRNKAIARKKFFEQQKLAANPEKSGLSSKSDAKEVSILDSIIKCLSPEEETTPKVCDSNQKLKICIEDKSKHVAPRETFLIDEYVFSDYFRDYVKTYFTCFDINPKLSYHVLVIHSPAIKLVNFINRKSLLGYFGCGITTEFQHFAEVNDEEDVVKYIKVVPKNCRDESENVYFAIYSMRSELHRSIMALIEEENVGTRGFTDFRNGRLFSLKDLPSPFNSELLEGTRAIYEPTNAVE